MNTLPFPPASRRTDPSTSRAAEARFTHSGARQTQADIVLAALRTAINRTGLTAMTAHELTEWCDLDSVQITRRLNDLRRTGRIEQCDKRQCRVVRQQLTTWRPTTGTSARAAA